MTHSNASFTGSIPEHYDQNLGPLFFEPYAKDLAKRLRLGRAAAVLEIAAGTGIVTAHLRDRLSPDARLVVTDLNPAMLDVARQKIPADDRLEWRPADAGALPFADGSFDAVVCQFGLMFFPDKPAALREIRRVLKPSGTVLFNVWGSLDDNPIGLAAHQVVLSFFLTDPPMFFTVPWGLHDEQLIRQLLKNAGYAHVASDTVDLVGTSESAEAAAKGLILGTPIFTAIQDRGTVDPVVITHALAARLASEGGSAPMQLPMRALVFTAIRNEPS